MTTESASTNVRVLKTPEDVREAARRASEREQLLAQEVARRAARFEGMAKHPDGLAS